MSGVTARLLIATGLALGAALSGTGTAWAYDAGIILYSGQDRGGSTLDIEDDVENLAGSGWNDRARSLTVTGGTWEVCRHAGCRDCVTVSAWDVINDLSRIGLDQAISSVRRIDRPAPEPAATTGTGSPIVWNTRRPATLWSLTSAGDCRPDIRAAFAQRFGPAGEGDFDGGPSDGRLTWNGKVWGYNCAYRQTDIWPED
ncbi:beta/gamma crystallin-related protein [Nitrospirillum sp. BR 11752]|uniref:beta/gamma crystallin-related protein n=1 Tax=Nitrospirillum sp. BR 11752 TaxID=3104293 RepID=UPI002EC56BBC|nr:beta/gamma crystallin-related protein [Nitrospirillum sp. BR 11752]